MIKGNALIVYGNAVHGNAAADQFCCSPGVGNIMQFPILLYRTPEPFYSRVCIAVNFHCMLGKCSVIPRGSFWNVGNNHFHIYQVYVYIRLHLWRVFRRNQNYLLVFRFVVPIDSPWAYKTASYFNCMYIHMYIGGMNIMVSRSPFYGARTVRLIPKQNIRLNFCNILILTFLSIDVH